MYRLTKEGLEILLVHPGGPFWRNRDEGAWMIPKGEVEPGEDLLAAAQREFTEETGFQPHSPFLPLGQAQRRSGKVVHAWAFLGNADPAALRSNICCLEYPPKSGRLIEIPEVDRGAFYTISEARNRILRSESVFLDALERILGREAGAGQPTNAFVSASDTGA